MGCPDVYYKKILILFLRNIGVTINISELSEDNLESMVLLEKQSIPEKDFYYAAGLAVAQIMVESMIDDSCDKVNTCIGGLVDFEELIGIREEFYE